ncbi:MAG: AsmA family protein [Usitatibacter sp.]
MSRLRRWVIGSAGAVAVLGVVGALALHALVDSERLKRVARAKAQAAWSRDLAIGEASLQLWPLPALHAENVTLANPSGSKYPYLLQAESVTARIALLPLLAGNVRIKGFDIEGVKVNLEGPKDGTAPFARRRESRPSEGELLDLTGISIANADITYRPRGAPVTRWRIEEAIVEGDSGLRNVQVEASIARNTRPLKVKAELADLSRYGIEGAVTQGRIELDWGRTQATIAGRIPLEAGARGHAITADLKSGFLGDMLAFFDIGQRPRARFEAHLESRESQGKVDVTRFKATLGKLTVTGDGQFSFSGPKTAFNARLETDRLDWAQTMLDAGGPIIAPLESPEIFHDEPLAWPLLVAMQGSEGKADAKIRSLRLRNGIELGNARATLAFDGDILNMSPFATEMLGGSASGSMRFEGRRKGVHVNFDGANLLLERWFRERGNKIPFSGGPMIVKASLFSAGNSMRELAAGVTGPMTIRMGPGVWASQKAGDAEAMMVGALSGKDSSRIEFECVGAAMPFTSGRAIASPLMGARSTVSSLLTSGHIDLRDESLDLRGRVKARPGAGGGLSIIAGDVKITGKIRQPKMSIEASGAVARVGAAIATAGISLVGTAIADAASADSDPCKAALGKS